MALSMLVPTYHPIMIIKRGTNQFGDTPFMVAKPHARASYPRSGQMNVPIKEPVLFNFGM